VIPPYPTPSDLLEPLEAGPLDPAYHYKPGLTKQERQQFDKDWQSQMSRSFAAKTQEWERYLSKIRGNASGYGLALIELENLEKIAGKKYHHSQNIKGSVRLACNRAGLASQMMALRSRPRPQKSEIADESQGRLRNAVADLLYRQTGLIYEPPTSLYTKAGLTPDVAS
jgi:hypothetical protein